MIGCSNVVIFACDDRSSAVEWPDGDSGHLLIDYVNLLRLVRSLATHFFLPSASPE